MRTALIFSGSSTWQRRDPIVEPDTTITPGPADPAGAAAVGLPSPDLVIAADSGWYTARCHGIVPHELIGDLDSIGPDDIDEAIRLGVEVHRFPSDKDATDLELAVDRAVAQGAEHVVVIGPGGGRLDHQLGELLLLASPRLADLVIDARLGRAWVHRVRGGPRTIRGRPGAGLSILAIAGPATVTTTGLRWQLSAEQLDPGSTRGISNEFEHDTATVGTEHGTVLVIVPEEEQER